MAFDSVRSLWSSPWTPWVGYRYLKSKKNSKFLSFITLISILGVALGVMAMLVVLSVMDGFESELKKRLMSSDLHVLVTPKASASGFQNGFVPKSLWDAPAIQEVLKAKSEIQEVWPIVSTEAILRSGKKVTGVSVKGVTPARLQKLRSIVTESAEAKFLIKREGAESVRLPSVFLGQELAYELGIIPGEQITLISPTETEGPLNSVPRFKRFVVEGIYRSGLPEQELHTVFAADSALRAFLRRAEVVSQWEITVKDFDQAPQVAAALRAAAPDLLVQDWVQLNSHLFASLRLERIAMFVILAFIVIVASFNIVTTLTLMVLEKKREISILKAMGARNAQVGAIFIAEGVMIGLAGVSLGTVSGLILCALLRRYEFITLPDIYYDRTLPVSFEPFYYFLIPACALSIVLIACYYPSRRAARLNPLDGIRFG